MKPLAIEEVRLRIREGNQAAGAGVVTRLLATGHCLPIPMADMRRVRATNARR